MVNIKPVNESNKINPVALDRKLDADIRIQESIKKVQPQFELDKQNSTLNQEELQRAIDQSNRLIFKDDSRFEFKMHERTGRIMVKLVDNKTDEIIKEIPPEKILDLVASIWDLVGILVDERG